MASTVRLTLLSFLLVFGVVQGYKCLGENYSIVFHCGKERVISRDKLNESSDARKTGDAAVVNLHKTKEQVKGKCIAAQELLAQDAGTIELTFSPSSQTVSMDKDWGVSTFPGLHANDLRNSFFYDNALYFKTKCLTFTKRGRFKQVCVRDPAIRNPLKILREKCPNEKRFEAVKGKVQLRKGTVDQWVFLRIWNGCSVLRRAAYPPHSSEVSEPSELQSVSSSSRKSDYTTPAPPSKCGEEAMTDYTFFKIIGDNCFHRFNSLEEARN
uniref:Uncharacterized protein n=1 Tax=Steinernema glaseri TaxID=37863 RepID=A0A1I7Z0C4_9BILA